MKVVLSFSAVSAALLASSSSCSFVAVDGLSAASSFTGRTTSFSARTYSSSLSRKGLVMYDSSGDPPNKGGRSADFNSWTVLANTEKWISATLQTLSGGSPAAGGGSPAPANAAVNNPYSRKEVSYACETCTENALIVSHIFRRLKEVRELGEQHGKDEQERQKMVGSNEYELRTLRQTQVVVIPGSPVMSESFAIFHQLMETINQARRNARDYVTDVALDKLYEEEDMDEDDEDNDLDWSVSVNLAHLHPKFGERTPEEQLQDLKDEDEAGEVDVHYQEYLRKKQLARQSPYPTLVVEVRSVPPPDFRSNRQQQVPQKQTDNRDEKVTSADLQKLEALFGKSAAMNHPSSSSDTKDDFFDSIGHILEEVTALTPYKLAQQWLLENDSNLPPEVVLTESSARHVDEAYEYVFANLAMMMEAASAAASDDAATTTATTTRRHYLVLPRFLSRSATSFEKFALEVQKIVSVLPEFSAEQSLHIQTFHPEHIDPSKRCPVPMYLLELNNN